MIVSSAPGKLYIAGEYAVVEPGYPAILVAVNQFLTVSLEKALDEGSITTYGSMPIVWTREEDKLVLDKGANRLFYIMAAINIVESYAKELGKTLDFYHLKVISELESPNGKKYGLGSSAAVTVATVESLCKYYEIELSKEQLFKLAALAQLNININGSCGDIAASAYGGWIAFTTFDKNWVLKQRKESSITEILDKTWPNLSIEPLTPPEELKLVIGWTGNPASTINLVDDVNNKRTTKSDIYMDFLYNSKECVTKIIRAFKENDMEEIQRQIHINRKLLVRMGNELNVMIETPILTKLCNIALKYNGYAKSSGAGGGDCGIAILKHKDNISGLIDEWEKEGITYLPLKVYEREGDKFDK